MRPEAAEPLGRRLGEMPVGLEGHELQRIGVFVFDSHTRTKRVGLRRAAQQAADLLGRRLSVDAGCVVRLERSQIAAQHAKIRRRGYVWR